MCLNDDCTDGSITAPWGFHMDLIHPLDASMKGNSNLKDSNYDVFQLSQAFNGSVMTNNLKDKESQRNYCCLTAGGEGHPYKPIKDGINCSTPQPGCAVSCSDASRPFEANSSNGMSVINYLTKCISQPIQKSAEYSANGYGKGEWYLPAIGEMAYLIGISPNTTIDPNTSRRIEGSYSDSPINKVNQTLAKLRNAGLKINNQEVTGLSGSLWSSTPAPLKHDKEALGETINQDISTFIVTINKDTPSLGQALRTDIHTKFRAGLSF